ncbi:Nitrogen assimilation transcription factor [Lachnellula occidentalis]|uniref:Nitrogen assimilation transcription factor n=1 Tax=Lachnellula occidentalis TaxID=215460 RepID=A0A8H8U7X1_9HELO|nr:Nitrogen assimilation transcription factor [Lachnellula occidentalis]
MADSSSSNLKRRRGLGIVTPNACTECRKKRAKCDGQAPCGRCASQKGVTCVYEVPVRQSKEHMRSEIEQLREQRKQTGRVLAALVSNNESEKVLKQLRDGATLEDISEQLERSGSMSSTPGGDHTTAFNEYSSDHTTTFNQYSDHQAIGSALQPARNIRRLGSSSYASSDVQGLDLPPTGQEMGNAWSAWGSEGQTQDFSAGSQADPMNWSPDGLPYIHHNVNNPLVGTWNQPARSSQNSLIQFSRSQGQETVLGHEFGVDHTKDMVTDSQSTGSWTSVTSDRALVEHLMALYFCWEYPTFASLNKEYFLEDYRSGSQRYCSSLLINAILALGCRFSDEAVSQLNTQNSDSAGDKFFAEAKRLLEAETDRHVLTTIQALGLMSIREVSCGRSSQSLYYSGQSIRLAIEMGLHREPEDEDSEDFRDNHAVRSATFWGAFSLDQAWSLSIGRLPQFSRDLLLVTKPDIVDEVEASDWVPYTDDGAPFERSCTQPSNIRSVYKTFCELSEIVHQTMYTLYTPGSPVTGKKLLDVYTKYLNWYESIPTALRLGQNFTPAVLFAHMYYHFAILLLFRPFIKLDIKGSGLSPRNVCSQAAEAITTLVHSYSKLYTLRRTPSFVPCFVLTSSIAHVVTLGTTKVGRELLQQGIHDLREMQACHGFAVRALDILHYLISTWKVDFSIESRSLEEELKYKQNPRSLCRASTSSLNQFCPNIQGVDLDSTLGPVKADENPLFWPFPLQGTPLLNIGAEGLEASGFRMLEVDDST